jgi:hypothetical protein
MQTPKIFGFLCMSGVFLLGLSTCAEKPEPYKRRVTTGTGQGGNLPGKPGDGSEENTADGNDGGSMTPSPSPTSPAPSPTPPVLSGNSPASGSVSLSFTTVVPSPAGRYTPAHVQAIFVTDMNDRLIKTLSAAPGRPAPAGQHLRRWRSLTNNTADGITGATLTAYGPTAAPIVWDLKARDGTPVPQGSYKIWFELTEANTTATIAPGAAITSAAPITGVDTVNGYRAHSVVIAVGAQASTKTDTSNAVFSNINVSHTP